MEEIKFCQSCGMPLDSQEIIGTEENGGENGDYCIYCYECGNFTEDVTMEEMIDISLFHMRELSGDASGFDEEAALEKMNSLFPELKRWKNS